jgi:hypothetical protein
MLRACCKCVHNSPLGWSTTAQTQILCWTWASQLVNLCMFLSVGELCGCDLGKVATMEEFGRLRRWLGVTRWGCVADIWILAISWWIDRVVASSLCDAAQPSDLEIQDILIGTIPGSSPMFMSLLSGFYPTPQYEKACTVDTVQRCTSNGIMGVMLEVCARWAQAMSVWF